MESAENVFGVKQVQNNLRAQQAGEDESSRSTTTAGKKNKTASGDSDQPQKMQ